jgi:hypothetical protein
MKANFSEGFAPLGASIQKVVAKFSGRTGTNMGKKKTASVRFAEFYRVALQKIAADDTGAAGQVRIKPPSPPKPVDQKQAMIQKPSVKGVSAPKVPFPTSTGIDKRAEEIPARYSKIQNRALRQTAVDNWKRSQQPPNMDPAGVPPNPAQPPPPVVSMGSPSAQTQNKQFKSGVKTTSKDIFDQMDSFSTNDK